MRTLLLLLTLLLSTAFAGALAARTAVAPVGGPSANNTVTKMQAWLEDQVSVSYFGSQSEKHSSRYAYSLSGCSVAPLALGSLSAFG